MLRTDVHSKKLKVTWGSSKGSAHHRINGRKIKTQQEEEQVELDQRKHRSTLRALKNLEVALFLDLTLRRIPDTDFL